MADKDIRTGSVDLGVDSVPVGIQAAPDQDEQERQKRMQQMQSGPVQIGQKPDQPPVSNPNQPFKWNFTGEDGKELPAPALSGASFSDAIAKQESAKPELNNPGNIKDPKTNQIKKFDSLDEGRAALNAQILSMASGNSPHYKEGITLRDAGKIYSGGDPNWATNVARMMGVSEDTPVSQLVHTGSDAEKQRVGDAAPYEWKFTREEPIDLKNEEQMFKLTTGGGAIGTSNVSIEEIGNGVGAALGDVWHGVVDNRIHNMEQHYIDLGYEVDALIHNKPLQNVPTVAQFEENMLPTMGGTDLQFRLPSLESMSGDIKVQTKDGIKSVPTGIPILGMMYSMLRQNDPDGNHYDAKTMLSDYMKRGSEATEMVSSPAVFGGEILGIVSKGYQVLKATEAMSKTLDYLQTVSKSSELMRSGTLLELTDATKQVEAARTTLDELIAARDAGSATATQEQVIAARNYYLELVGKVNQSTTSLQKAEEAANLAKVRVENTQDALGRLYKETQTLPNQLIAAMPKSVVQGAMYAQKPIGYSFAVNAIPGLLTPQQKGESTPDYINRVFMSGGMVATGVGELAGDAKTMGDYFGGAKSVFEVMANIFKRSTGEQADVWQKSKAQNEAKKAFFKAIPPGKGNSDFSENDYWAMRPFMENEHAQDDIAHPERMGDAMEHVRQGIENQVRVQVDKYGNEGLRLGVNADGTAQTLRQKVAAKLLPNERVTPGFTDEALEAIEKYNIDNPSLSEADVLRKQINNLVRDKMSKNGWDRARLMAVDPEFAGLMHLNEALRDGIYGTLDAVGVKGSEEMRQLEVSASKIRDASYKQNHNAEVARRGTGEQSTVKKLAAEATGRLVGGTVGGLAGSVAGVPGEVVGGVIGQHIGGKIAEKIAKPNQTVEQLLKTSLAATGAPDHNVAIDATGAKTPTNAPPEHPRARENPDLHAKLQQYFVADRSLADKPYRDLETAFTTKYERTVRRGLKPDADEKSIYLEIQKAKNEDNIAAKEAAVKAAEQATKVSEAQEKAEEQAIKAEVQKAEEEKLAKAGKPRPIESPEAQGEKSRKKGQAIAAEEGREGETIAVEPPTTQEILKGKPKPAGRTSLVGKVVGGEKPATEPWQKTPMEELPEGHTDLSLGGHEFGHGAEAAIEGIGSTDIASHLHKAVQKLGGVGGIGWRSKPYVLQEGHADRYTPEELRENTNKWMRIYMGGAASNLMLDNIPFDIEHPAFRGDVRQARNVLEAAGVIDKAEQNAMIQEHFDKAHNNLLTIPGVRETIEANRGVREQGLGTDLHASEERMANFQNEITRLANEHKNRLTNAANGREVSADEEGQPGILPEGKSTLSRGRKEGAGGAEAEGAAGRGGVNHEDVLEKIKTEHGVTNDTAGIQNGQSFITPEGQFVHLPPGTAHTDAITAAGGPAPGPENGHDNRPAFINDTGAIRVHLANERAGRTLAASVPADGVQNAEQVNALQQLVGKELPRTGNVRLERADVNAENKNEASTEKAFPRVSDVPKMLKKIGALSPKVERSLMTAEAMKGMKEAREEEPVNNAKEPTKVPTLVPALIEGGTHAEPKATYHEAAKTEGNPWVRRSADPAKSAAPTNKGRQLMIQISSDLINGTKGEADQASAYYDKLYSGARPGYARMNDFWEIPQWQGFVSHVLPDADTYVVRNIDQAKEFLKNAKYDRVLASALDVNTSFLKDIAKSVPEQAFDVGGYVEPGTFLDAPNVKYHSSVENMVKDPYYVEQGIKYDNGTDYRHYEGSDVIPRLTMSDGCLHKCAFCVVEKKLTTQPNAVVDQQAESMGKLGAKLVYLNDKTFGQAPNYQHLSDVYAKMKEANPDFQGFVVQTTAAQMRKIPADWLQKSGIKYVELGVESYNDPILKEMHKPANEKLIDEATDKLRENNIALIPNILIGLPGENANTYAHTLEFLKRNKDIISHANIYNLAVYKDAELGKKLTTANEGDFNENVLEKSFHQDPEVHRVFAGDLYGVGQELLANTPTPLARNERSMMMRPGREHSDHDISWRSKGQGSWLSPEGEPWGAQGHRGEGAALYSHEEAARDKGYGSIDHALDEGNIRFTEGTNGAVVHMVQPPTDEQKAYIAQMFKRNDGVTYDIEHQLTDNQRTITSGEAITPGDLWRAVDRAYPQERSVMSARNNDVKHINDLNENDLMFKEGQQNWHERAAESNKTGGFTIHPETGHVPTEGHVIEVSPEHGQTVPGEHATAEQIKQFHEANKPLFEAHPELHVGGYGNELNVSAVGTPEGARTVGNKLDQKAAWDARNQEVVPLAGKGEQKQFPNYPLEQRLQELGARTPEGKPTGTGTPPERSNLAAYKGNKISYKDARSLLDELIPDDKVAHRAALTSLYQYTGGNKFVSRDWLNDLTTKARAASMQGGFSQPLKVEQPNLGQPIQPNRVYQEPLKPVNKQAALDVFSPNQERSELSRVPNVPERSTGNPDEDAIIKQGGGIPGGLLGTREQGVRMFHDPITHTTLGFGSEETATPEAVIAKLLASRQEYAKVPANRAKYRLNENGTVAAERSLMSRAKGEEPKYPMREHNGYDVPDWEKLTPEQTISAVKDSSYATFSPDEIRDGYPWLSDVDRAAGVTPKLRQDNANESGFLHPDGSMSMVGDSFLHDAYEHEIGLEDTDIVKKAGIGTYNIWEAPHGDNVGIALDLPAKPTDGQIQTIAALTKHMREASGDKMTSVTVEWPGGSKEIEFPTPGSVVRELREPERSAMAKKVNEDGTVVQAAPVKPFNVEWKPNGQYGVVNPKGLTLDTFPTREAAETAAQRMAEQSARVQGERSAMAKKAKDQTEPQPVGSTVKLLKNPLPIEGTGASGEITTADVGQALAAHTAQKLPVLNLGEDDPAMVERAKSIMRDEAKYQMAQNNSGAEWYTKDIGEHDKILGEMRPELKDPTKLSLFKFAEATLSAGHDPVDNFNATLQAWDHYHETGEFPLKNPNNDSVWGRYGYKAYANALSSINQLIEDHGGGTKGEKGAVDWLLSNHSVSELKKYNPNVLGAADLERPGAVILGPKRGPFALNLHGREAEFTADQWVDRSWNRWMGTAKLDPRDPSALDDKVSAKERPLMKQSFEEVADELGLSTSSLQAVMWYYEQGLYDAHGVPTKPKSFSEAARAAQDNEASSFNFGHNAPIDLEGAARKGALDKLSKK